MTLRDYLPLENMFDEYPITMAP